jgi:hypothetical protein
MVRPLVKGRKPGRPLWACLSTAAQAPVSALFVVIQIPNYAFTTHR